MTTNQFTVEVYKKDNRITSRSKSIRSGKNKTGLRFVKFHDHEGLSRKEVEELCKAQYPEAERFVTNIYETYVIRKNMMSGEEYKERYNTPSYCSPSSESYWSM